MRREHYQARLLRALSGKTQEKMAKEVGIHPVLLGQIELGDVMPTRHYLEKMARIEGLTLEDTAELLELAETLRRTNQRNVRSEEGFAGLEETLHDHIARARRRLLALPTEPLHAWIERRLREESARVADQVEAAAALARVAEKVAAS
jgi:transcriptional regulator with XRE-family HTH domain